MERPWLNCFLLCNFKYFSHFQQEFDLLLKLEAGKHHKSNFLTNDIITKFDRFREYSDKANILRAR